MPYDTMYLNNYLTKGNVMSVKRNIPKAIWGTVRVAWKKLRKEPLTKGDICTWYMKWRPWEVGFLKPGHVKEVNTNDGFRYTKIVLLPILVPYGDCCIDEPRICQYFNTEGGNIRCTLELNGHQELVHDESGHVQKPPFCKELKEQKRNHLFNERRLK